MKHISLLLMTAAFLVSNSAWAAKPETFRNCVMQLRALWVDGTKQQFGFDNHRCSMDLHMDVNWEIPDGGKFMKLTICNSDNRKECVHRSILVSSIKTAPPGYFSDARHHFDAPQQNSNNGPSREETAQFISDNLQQHSGTRIDGKFTHDYTKNMPGYVFVRSETTEEAYAKYSNIRWSGCTLTWTAETGDKAGFSRSLSRDNGQWISTPPDDSWHDKDTRDARWSFSGTGLAKLQPFKHYNGAGDPEDTYEMAPPVYYVSLTGEKPDQFVKPEMLGFFFDDQEVANQMVKAFRRMSQLCGGRAAPFEE